MEQMLRPVWQKRFLALLLLLSLGAFSFQLARGVGVIFLQITDDRALQAVGYFTLVLSLFFFMWVALGYFILELRFKVNRLFLLLLLLLGWKCAFFSGVTPGLLHALAILQVPLFCVIALQLFMVLSAVSQHKVCILLNRIMWGLFFATLFLLVTDGYHYNFLAITLLFFYGALLAIFMCFRKAQRNALRRWQRGLLVAFVLVYLPAEGASLLGIQLPYYGLFKLFYLLVPGWLGFLLLKGKHKHVPAFIKALAVTCGFGLLILSGLFLFCIKVADFSFIDCLLATTLGLCLLFAAALLQEWLLDYKFAKVQHAGRQVQTELVEQAALQQHLRILSKSLMELVSKTLANRGLWLLWQEEGRITGLYQSGLFLNKNFKALGKLPVDWTVTELFQQTAVILPLVCQQQVSGWLIVAPLAEQAVQLSALKDEWLACGQMVSQILSTAEVLQKGDFLSSDVSSGGIRPERINQLALEIVEKTRRDLSYYLHDHLLQTILALNKLAQASLASGKNTISALTLIAEELAQLNVAIRQRMFVLYPSTLNDLPFAESLAALAADLQEKNGASESFQIVIDATDVLVPPELRFTLYRMIGELLQNALKYSQGQRVTIEVTDEGEVIQVLVQDDGIGLDWKQADSCENQHFGLLSVASEVKILNGKLELLREEAAGTQWLLRLPKAPERLG